VKEEASKKYENIKDRRLAKNELKKLKKRDLIKFCKEWDVEYSKDMTKPELIDAINFSSSLNLSTKIVEDFTGKKIKKPSKKSTKVSEKIVQDYQIEQEIVRTEKIKTKVKKRTTTLTKLRKHIKNFSPITPRRSRISEKAVEAQMVQNLSAARA
jgi:hypothetical protein